MFPAIKSILIAAATSGLLAVVFGAFGAHALKARLTESLLSAYQTGVQYHFYHTLALLAVGILLTKGFNQAFLLVSGGLFIGGILFFSGSLYWLALGGPSWLGPVTPLGGTLLILGWFTLILAILRS